jgi:hypothetical protein
VDNPPLTGDSVALRPQPSRTIENMSLEPGCHPHRHGDGFSAPHQHGVVVIHNPQPLLPLLRTFLSTSLISDWGHSRKDKLA